MSVRRTCLLIAGLGLLSGCNMYYGTNPTASDRAGTLNSGPPLDERTGQPPTEWPQTIPATTPPAPSSS